MADSPEHMQIEYGLYIPSDAEPMATLLGEVFSRYDPPAVAVGLTTSEFEAFARLLCPKVADEGRQSWLGWSARVNWSARC